MWEGDMIHEYIVPSPFEAEKRGVEYYNPMLPVGRKQKDDSAAAAPAAAASAAAASAAGDEDKKKEKKEKPKRGSFCNQRSFKFADINIISIGKLIFEMIMIITGRLNLLFVK